MKDFKKLMIWQNGMKLVKAVYQIARHLPAEEVYGMRSQCTRAAVSIPANIAEGSAKRSEKEYVKYLETSLASSFELETHLLIIQDQGWISDQMLENVFSLLSDEQRMLNGFISKILKA